MADRECVPQQKARKKRKLRLLLALALGTFTLAVTTARAVNPPPDGGLQDTVTAAAANLIVNGGFETGDLTGWLMTIGTTGAVTSTEAHDGTYSMEMQAVDIIYQEFAAADKLHAKSLQFWAKGDIFAGPAYATVYYRDGTSDQLSFGGASLSSGDWTEFILMVKRKKVVVEVLIETGETTPIYVDDVRLRQFVP